MLKTTARMLPGLIAVALGFSVTHVSAEPISRDPNSTLDRVGAASGAGSRLEDRRQQADDLLRRARQAMTESDLETADRLIAQAEALDVRYGPMYFGDTAQKARRDLDRKRLAVGKFPLRAGSTGSTRPGDRPDASPVDPFVSRGADPAASLLPDAKSQAKTCILKARKELAQRNLLGATYWYSEATRHQAAFGPSEDSPDKLAADIRRAGGSPDEPDVPPGLAATKTVIPLPPTDSMTQIPPSAERRSGLPAGMSSPAGAEGRDAGRAQAGELLLAARRALALGDVRRARDKVQQVRAMGVQYGPTDDTPEKVETLVGRLSDLMAQRADRGNTDAWRREHARILMDQADGLLRWRDLDEAERLATEALRLRVQFSPYEPRPEGLLDRIAAIRRQGRRGGDVIPASGEMVAPATGADFDRRASHAVYDQANDPTRNILAADSGQSNPGLTLFQQGEAALKAHDTQTALQLFRQAYQHVGDLDPTTARHLQDHLQMLTAAATASARPAAAAPSAVDDAAAKQQLAARQLASEVAHNETTALKVRETDPKSALSLLEQTRSKVESSGLDSASKDQLLRRIDRDLADLRKYIAENRPRIELEEKNRQVRQEIDRERQGTLDFQNKLAQKVDEFNSLVHEHRFAEAEVVAKQALELAPDNQLANQLVTEAKMLRHFANAMAVKGNKEDGFMREMGNVDVASIPFDSDNPYLLPEARQWRDLTTRRSRFGRERGRRMSEREVEIRNKLKTPVSLQFENAPLTKVIDSLAQLAGVNIYLDPQGLADQGVTTDSPINIDLRQEIKLESALNLILRPLRLSWVIKDEVLKITSEDSRKGEIYTETYNVADLVIPIPNFVPNGGLGLEGAYRGAMAANVSYGNGGFPGGAMAPLAAVASRDGRPATAAIDPTVMAQLSPNNRGSVPTNLPISNQPGNLGGGAMADFDSLIELITATIQPDSWDELGGAGSIAPFEINLSLVVSNTQEVHDQIVDLLEQLRRMQDLQVTIEVRFITLNDNFFERIGVDFDFAINDRTDHPGMIFGRVTSPGTPGSKTSPPVRDTRPSLYKELGHDSSMTVGLSAPNVFTADLDIPFTQDSFTLAVPQFGGYNPGSGATMGFAILSEIEAFFFMEAAQADRRSNVLQAPKVTLFNGQYGMVSDQSQSPFVMSVIPVVGDFAAANQPVIVVLSEGTFLSVQAVVSSDRRFVRLTVVPYFSQIGKVDTFTFVGTETTVDDASASGVQDQPNDSTKKTNRRETTRGGTTVQLPTFSFFTVNTTVSVPDGGTVLLGGIKRLKEGRNEAGVPILNKIPYINRLFKNVGIGRETQSLMMMVTPRIIIQEEEEEKLLGAPPRS